MLMSEMIGALSLGARQQKQFTYKLAVLLRVVIEQSLWEKL